MSSHELAFWTILVGAVANSACALVGCYLVLRRMSLLGDAISHAVLPGLVVAFLITGQLTSLPMFIGAMVLGVLTAFLTETLRRFGGVPEDASMGAVFTSLFAFGVLLLSNYASSADLDPGCVLYGLIDLVPLNYTLIAGWKVPVALQSLLVALVGTSVFITLFWKELKISSFDAGLATAMGINATLMHYLLIGVTAAVTVAAFEAVGSILVIAMLIVPAATAHLLTDRLGRMLAWSVVVAVLSSVLGFYSARALNTTVAGMMAVMAGAQFALTVLLAPRHGLLGRAINNFSLSLRIVGEDVVAMLYRLEELGSRAARPSELSTREAVAAVGGGLAARWVVPRLRRAGDIELRSGGTLGLTEQGRRRAQSVVRSHRLWEAFLVEHFQLPLDHLHAPAERVEHFIGPQLQEELAAELQTPGRDPHGRAIPPPT